MAAHTDFVVAPVQDMAIGDAETEGMATPFVRAEEELAYCILSVAVGMETLHRKRFGLELVVKRATVEVLQIQVEEA